MTTLDDLIHNSLIHTSHARLVDRLEQATIFPSPGPIVQMPDISFINKSSGAGVLFLPDITDSLLHHDRSFFLSPFLFVYTSKLSEHFLKATTEITVFLL